MNTIHPSTRLRHRAVPFAALFALLVHPASIRAATLINVTQQNIRQTKNFTIGYFSPGVTQVGENVSFTALAGATSFDNTWDDTVSFSGVMMVGNSSLDYGFSDNTFTFSSTVSTSRDGTSSEDITAVPRGAGTLDITFILNESANVFFDVFGMADNNGTGGSGGAPYANTSLQRQTGTDEFGPIFEAVFPRQSSFDSTVGNGADEFSLSDSALLEPGTYNISARNGNQNLYHQRFTNVSSSAQSSSVNLTARFEPITESIPEPSHALLSLVGIAAIGLRRRRTS